MNWIIYFFGSGTAFYAGVALVLASILLFSRLRTPLIKGYASLLAFVGLLLIAASATPLPYWVYIVGGITSVLWLIAERSAISWLTSYKNCLRLAAALSWVISVAFELPHEFRPMLEVRGNPPFAIIGDSVAAGMGGEKTTWPKIIKEQQRIYVIDRSQPGATAASALKQAQGIPGDSLVLIEIGGNDLLGVTSSKEFERDLNRLLAEVCQSTRLVTMFELPSLPLCNEFGRVQRRMAEKYHVKLIPKRIFASVLTSDGATVDSVHLTPAGHQQMAKTVWDLVQPVYSAK